MTSHRTCGFERMETVHGVRTSLHFICSAYKEKKATCEGMILNNTEGLAIHMKDYAHNLYHFII